ncbi:MAG: response regulator [bacterium]|nr:response regulator [bacterium]
MKYSILYVDDEIENLRSFYAVFRRDFDVVTSQSPKEALEILKNQEFQLILSDQKMPGITGIEFLSQVHELLGNQMPKCMIVSGYTKDDIIHEAFQKIGLFAFISKPWKEEVMREKINEGIHLTLEKTAQTNH